MTSKLARASGENLWPRVRGTAEEGGGGGGFLRMLHLCTPGLMLTPHFWDVFSLPTKSSLLSLLGSSVDVGTCFGLVQLAEGVGWGGGEGGRVGEA